MPGDLWTGYLQAEAADVAEVEREEEKKKQRLEEQLQKLNMEGLRRTIDRDAREWEIEEAGRAQREEMLSGLRDFFGEEAVDAALMGLSGLGPKKEQEPWFIGTPHEERGLGKEFYIKPETPKRASVSWLNAPKKKEAEIQKWVTAWEKHTFDPEEKKMYVGLKSTEKRKYFDDWAKQIPRSTSAQRLTFYEVRKRVGMDPTASGGVSGIPGVPPPEKPRAIKEEDEFIKEARGKEDKINWDAIATKYPKWNLFYIKQKLGVNE